ncbi:hypothetical protein WJX84_004503, partial [Apatococcus fuscideae]
MDESLYDEFGNYIGPALESDEEDQEVEEEVEEDLDDAEAQVNARMDMVQGNGDVGPTDMEEDEEEGAGAVVLHEDKKYYPTAEEVYGKETETLVMDEDAQPLEVPIIQPIKAKKLEVAEREPQTTSYDTLFLTGLMATPELARNVAIVGHLHHGKTRVMDMLVEQTHSLGQEFFNPDGSLRFMDTRLDEQERGISLKMVPMSLVLQSSTGKSYLVNLIDTPGHINFNDEVSAAMRMCDGVLLVVDVVEGVMVSTEKAVRQAMQENLPICLLISKMDRLITELKLPPRDAYFKLRHTIDEVNALIQPLAGGREELL